MASVSTDSRGLRRILFVHPDGTRKAIRLGRVSQRAADQFKYRVERLVEAVQLKQSPDPETATWAVELDARQAPGRKALELGDDAPPAGIVVGIGDDHLHAFGGQTLERSERSRQVFLDGASLHQSDVAGELPVAERKTERLFKKPARNARPELDLELRQPVVQRVEERGGARRVAEAVRADEGGETTGERHSASLAARHPPPAVSSLHPASPRRP